MPDIEPTRYTYSTDDFNSGLNWSAGVIGIALFLAGAFFGGLLSWLLFAA